MTDSRSILEAALTSGNTRLAASVHADVWGIPGDPRVDLPETDKITPDY
ncbi:hypothetical protein ABIB73_006787 [Bradyrhizobium sp. F1.4.3]